MIDKEFVPFALETCKEYPNFKVRFVKGCRIEDVPTITLSDMGFPADLPVYPLEVFEGHFLNHYFELTSVQTVGVVEKAFVIALLTTKDVKKAFAAVYAEQKRFGVTEAELAQFLKSGEVFFLDAQQAEEILHEFVFLIDKLLPRKAEDFFYSLGLKPRPLYWYFFDLAADYMELERYTNKNKSNYWQFVTHPYDGIRRYYHAGCSLKDIYENTCVTKTMLMDAVASLEVSGKLQIEKILFKSGCTYKRNYSFPDFCKETGAKANAIFDFAVFEKDKLLFLMDYDNYGYRYVYNERTGKGHFLSKLKYASKKKEYCSRKNIPYLLRNKNESYFEEDDLSCIIRAVIDNPKSISNDRRKYYYATTLDKIMALPFENYTESLHAKKAGCLACGSFFPADRIQKWNGACALCPVCESVPVILDSQGFDFTEDLMENIWIIHDELFD